MIRDTPLLDAVDPWIRGMSLFERRKMHGKKIDDYKVKAESEIQLKST